MKLKLLILSFFVLFSVHVLQAQNQENFESASGTSFTNTGQTFNISAQLSGPFTIVNFAGTGWNGTSADNRYIDNSGGAVAGAGTQFTISSSSSFKMVSIYLYLADHNANNNVNGSLTIVGKLSGSTVFTANSTANFNNKGATSNGFTLINFATFGGSDNTGQAIDQLVISTTTSFEYVALDAFKWNTASTPPTVTSTAASSIGGTSAVLGGNVTSAGSASVTERGIVWATTTNPTISNNKVTNGSGTGTFSGTVGSLPSSTLIYFRAYATSSAGTSYGSNLTFTTAAALSTSATGQTNLTCNGVCTGSASVTPSGGSGNYTYSWAPSGGSGASASSLCASNYTCTITDDVGASITRTFTITQPPALTSSVVSQTNIACNGGTTGAATITASGGTGTKTYAWTPGNPTGNGTVSVSGLGAATYTCTITDANSCTKTQTVSITAPSAITSSVSSQTNVACNGGTTGAATITTSGGAGSNTYSWAPGNPTGNGTLSVSGLAANTYTCTITDANSCTKTQTVSITAPSAITSSVSSQTNVACNGGTTGAATITTSGGAGSNTYSWSPAPGAGQGTLSVTGLGAATYTCTITDANSCTKTQTVSITAPSAITSSVSSQTNVACNGGTTGAATITTSGGAGSNTYSWSPAPGAGQGTLSVSGLGAATYTCTITDANSCTKTQTVSITAPSAITSSVSSQTNVACNGGTTGAATITTSGGAGSNTYSWAPGNPTGNGTLSVSGLAANTYTCTITDANSCTKTQTVSITAPSAITSSVVSQTNVACNGGTTGAATITSSGGTGTKTYSWAPGNPTGQGTVSISGLGAATYTCTITDANSCTKTQTVSITAPSAITSSVSSQTNVACNGGTTGAATISTSGGAGSNTYSWAPGNPTGQGTVSISNLAANTYTCTITDANSCTKTQTVTITEAALKSLSVSTTPLCSTVTMSLNLNGETASTIAWYGPTNTLLSTSSASGSATQGTTVAGGNGFGTGSNQLWRALDVHGFANGDVFVADQNNVTYWASGSTTKTIIANHYSEGIFVDDNYNLYVSNQTNHSVEKYTWGSTIPTVIAGGNGSGSGLNQLNTPEDVFVTASGTLYVADRGNNRIVKWTSGATSGTVVAGGNGSGSALNQIDPRGIVVEGTTMYISDHTNQRIIKWVEGNTAGTVVAGGNGQGNAANQFNGPGRFNKVGTELYVAEMYGHRVSKWTEGASTGTTIAGTAGSAGASNTLLWQPFAAFALSNGAFFVADDGNHRVQRYGVMSPSSTYTTSVSGNNKATVTYSDGCQQSVTTNITLPTVVANNTATGTQTVCSGATPASLTGSTPTGGNGTYTYTWLKSTTSATAGFTAASGTNTGKDYAPAALTQTTWFRRAVVAGACPPDTSAAVAITVNTAIAGNTATGTQTICSGSTPATITGSTPTGGNGTSYTYAWLSSTTSATAGFSAASGTANAKDYSPAALSANTWFKRVVTSGACSADTSAAVAITINTAVAGNTATGTQTICSGSTPTAITGSTPTGGNGTTYTYAWLSSTTSATAGFSGAAGTANAKDYSPSALTANTWFKRVVTSGACSADTSAAVAITVNPVIASNTIGSNQSILTNTTPSPLTGSTPTGGNSTYTYLWLSSTTSATAGFSAASGTNNAQGYAPGSLSQNTWYRRLVTSGSCSDTSAAVAITVNSSIAGNTISAPQSICSGSAPAQLTGGTPTGGTGVYTYTWLSSTTSGTTGFTAASGTNNAINYTPGTLTQNTWFRRYVTSGPASDTSAAVMITVNVAIAGNTATGTQTICSGSTPTAITGSTPTGGNGTTYTYAWLSSTTSATAGFSAASGTANAKDYSPAALSANTWYKRVVTSGACSADTSAAVAITVNVAITNNTASGVQTICSGATPTTLSGSTATGGNGSTYFYQWLSSTTSATAGFAAAAGTNNTQNYVPSALTQTTWFRRRATSGACNADTSAAVMITVNTAIAGNTATGAQTICSGAAPTALTGSTPTGGNGSTYTYTWLSSTTSATAGFSAASGTNSNQNYSPAALSANTWFKRVVSSGVCSNDTSAAVAITVNTAIAGNTATGVQTICSGTTPTAITGSTPTGGNGSSYTYAWISSTTSATAGFSAASGTANAKDYSPAALTATTWYRRIVSSGACNADTAAAVQITVSPAIAANTVTGGATICLGNTANLTGSTPTGGSGSSYTYAWISSTTSATAGFSAAAGTNTTQNYTTAAITAGTWYKRIVTSGGCTDTSAAAQVTVTNTNTWTGATSNVWNLASNWSCNLVPTSATNVVINTGTPNMPSITDARSVNNITITGGTLTLTGSSAWLSINGTITNTGGTFTANAGKVSFTGTTGQVIPAATYNKLEINNTAGVTLGGNISLNDSIFFVNGNLSLGNFSVTLNGTTGQYSGANSSKFIITDGTGSLNIQNIGTGGRTGNVTFPVGTSATSYNPVVLNNTGTADEFRVGVIDSVNTTYTGHTPGGSRILTNVVHKTWFIDEVVAGGSNASVTLQWNAPSEAGTFTRNNCYVGRFNGTSWTSVTGATASGSGPYTQIRSGITAFSPFSVGGVGSQLPVELISFTGVRRGNAAELQWATASELNNDHFVIARSADGKSFEAIQNVKGNGTSSILNNYSLTDAAAAAFAKQHAVSTIYYRLQQVDMDGSVSEPRVITVNMAQQLAQVSVSPNPFTHQLNITVGGSDEQVKVTIMDAAGRTVLTRNAAVQGGSLMLQGLDTLEDGVYFIHVSGNDASTTQRIVKTH